MRCEKPDPEPYAGISVLAAVVAIFLYALHTGKGEVEARTLTFAILVTANLTLIMANLSWSQSLVKTLRSDNKALKLVLAGALLGLFWCCISRH